MLLNLIKLAVQDIANPDDVVILTSIVEGVDGASYFGVREDSPNPLKIEDGQTVQQRFSHTIDIRGLYDATDMAQLRTWSGAQTPVRITGFTQDGFVLFDGSYLLNPNTQYDSVHVTALKVSVEWLGNYVGGYRQIHIGQNGLRNYDTQAGSGTLLFGWTAETGLTASLSGDDQTLTRASSTGTFGKSAAFFFPFEGETITFSLFLATAAASNDIGIRFLDDTGATISDTTDSPSGSGTFGVTAVVPAGTFFVQAIVNPGDTASDTVIFINPCLRMGTSTVYTNW
jgi:hypothetical protein